MVNNIKSKKIKKGQEEKMGSKRPGGVGVRRGIKAETNNGGKKLTKERWFIKMDQGTELEGIRKKLFLDRYALKDEQGEPLEKFPEQMWRRVARAIAQVEKTADLRAEWEEKFYAAMQNFRFCPAGRFLTSAGTGTDTTMINCYVIPSPEDTRKGIIKTLEQVTEISARGGGVGFNLSSLRPKGSYLKAVNGTSSGVVNWAELYSVTVHDIIQQGGTRRGALMMMMWDWHPDVEEFITVKKKQGKILGANLSVCISDGFMKAVEGNKDWELKFPDTEFEKYRSEWEGDLLEWESRGYPVKISKTINARGLWNLICESAWESAEPGVIFMEQANKMNNTWYFEKNVSTNPCGEQHLPAWGVCNLSSINLSALVREGKFNWEDFKEVIKVGVRFLDNAVDAESYLYEEIKTTQLRERRLGLGTLGLADALIKMKVRYGSEESLQIIDEIYRTLRDVAYQTSIELAAEKGSFPMFKVNNFLRSGFMKTMPEEMRTMIKQKGIRNALILTEAPTGKIALLAGASSGIEPVFSFAYQQKDRLGERMMYHPLFQEWKDKHADEEVPDYFVVADDLVPEEHVKIQALIQKYTDASISKTVNAPEAHSVEEVKKLYTLAFESGCKGISYMREGSREGTLVRNPKSEIRNSKKEEEVVNEGNGEVKKPKSWVRPLRVEGSTYRMDTPIGRAFVTVNHDEEGSPVELFITVGRAGSDITAMAEALGRLISKSLKFDSGLSSRERAKLIIEQLTGIGSSRSVGFGARKIYSLPDAVAKALAMDMGLIGYSGENNRGNIKDSPFAGASADRQISKIKNDEPVEQLKINGEENGIGDGEEVLRLDLKLQNNGHLKDADFCPDCGNATLVYEMGCKTCHGCGYSEC